MAVRFSNPYVQWVDGNSVVQAGASLYFYDTGTTTPKSTYSDANLTIPNTNPVVSDGDGVFGAIFLEPGLYKAVLKDADGNTLWTADPVGSTFESVDVTGTFALSGYITPGQITATQDNYSPTNGASTTVWRLNSDASRNITGISGGSRGRVLIIENVGSFNIVLKNENSGSTAANRFSLPSDVTLQPKQSATLWYDETLSRWVAISYPVLVTLTASQGVSVSGYAISGDASFFRGQIAGLTLSNNGSDANNDIDVAVGVAVDDGASYFLKLSSAITKRLDASWAVGTNQGGLDTGAKANSTWYHVWLIGRTDTGVIDVIFSTSATSPTMPTSYDKKRRIGAVRTDSSGNILAFKQVEETFYLATAILDINSTSLGTSANLVTLTTPGGVKTRPLIRTFASVEAGAGSWLITSPDETDVASVTPGNSGWSAAPGSDLAPTGNVNHTLTAQGFNELYTNTSSQLRVRSTLSSNRLQIVTRGWVDSRGRFD